MSDSVPMKKTKGRQKIEMKKIANKKHLQVAFTKRRKGLFKKAEELSVLCGVDIAIFVQSPGNKMFSFRYPPVQEKETVDDGTKLRESESSIRVVAEMGGVEQGYGDSVAEGDEEGISTYSMIMSPDDRIMSWNAITAQNNGTAVLLPYSVEAEERAGVSPYSVTFPSDAAMLPDSVAEGNEAGISTYSMITSPDDRIMSWNSITAQNNGTAVSLPYSAEAKERAVISPYSVTFPNDEAMLPDSVTFPNCAAISPDFVAINNVAAVSRDSDAFLNGAAESPEFLTTNNAVVSPGSVRVENDAVEDIWGWSYWHSC